MTDAFSGPLPDQHQLDLKRTTVLCNPADKNSEDPGAPAHVEHLEGYVAAVTKLRPPQPRPTPQLKTIQNQLGTLKLKVTAVKRLLVPSSKVLGTSGAPPLGSPTLDHFKCYKAGVAKAPRGQPPYPVFAPVTVTVTDQFRGALQLELVKPILFCAPADKNGESPDAPAHAAHLVCYQVKLAKLVPPQTPFAKARVSTNNQFGPEVIDAVALEGLCVPSAKLD